MDVLGLLWLGLLIGPMLYVLIARPRIPVPVLAACGALVGVSLLLPVPTDLWGYRLFMLIEGAPLGVLMAQLFNPPPEEG